MKQLLSALLVFLSAASLTEAQENAPIVLAASTRISFVPSEAHFFVTADDAPTFKHQGAVVVASVQGDSQERNVVAGMLYHWPSGARAIRYQVILMSEQGQLATIPTVTVRAEDKSTAGMSTSALREAIERAREELRAVQLQRSKQRANHERLKRDAAVIGNVERIVAAKQEVDFVQGELDALLRDEARLKRLLNLARQAPNPLNFRFRELTLASESTALNNAAREAERSEFQRRMNMERELQLELKAMEKARAEDPAELERDLERLRQRRKEMEARYGVLPVPPAPSATDGRAN
ncbi:MAG: hypothetical protein QY326_04960 [Bdellovibrionota bacterium]|nr:MAG: hypothetical protein QY326_04960 [Bdellovibrionota bacterium]